MKISEKSKKTFLASANVALPGLIEILNKQECHVYLIGAGAFEIYSQNEWCMELSRSTQDLDFSFEIISDEKNYESSCEELIKLKYKKDGYHPYRYHSPYKGGPFIYVDLLTFTVKKELENQVRAKMGVGEEFSFKGMDFAKEGHIELHKNIYIPNPLAFIFLKMTAYRESPDRRVKDFVDIFELIVGISERGEIFEDLKKVVINSQLQENIKEIKKMLKGVIEDSSTNWDYDLVENQIKQRDNLVNYSQVELQTFFNIFHENVFK